MARNAPLLWAAQFISASGDALFMPCLAWIASRDGRSASLVGLAVFLGFLPYLVLGPLAGAWVDRTARRRVMVASDLLRAVLLGLLPLWVALAGGLTYGLIVLVGVLLASFSTPFLPARDALLPDLVGARSLPRWNAIMQTSGQIAMIAGLGLGGLLLTGQAGEAGVLLVLQLDGLTFLLSAVLLLLIAMPRQAAPAVPRQPFWTDVREGLSYAWGDRVVGGLLVLTALNNLAIMGPAIVGAALLVQRTFGLEAGHYAWFEGAMALGMVLGSVGLAVLGRRWSLRRLILWGMVLDGVTYLPFLWIEDYGLALVAIALHGVCIPMIVIGRTSLIQAHVAPGRRGRIFALVGLTVVGMTALSAALSGWIADVLGTRALFGVAGVFGALCGLAGLRLWRFEERAEVRR